MEQIFPTIVTGFREIAALYLPSWAVDVVSMLLKVMALATFVIVMVMFLTYVERRMIGRMQNRIGPNRVGPKGLLQPVADAIKLLFKESIVPRGVDRWPYELAPVVTFVPALMMFAVIPFGEGLALAELNIGILYVIAMTTVGILGVFMAGWSSNNKFAMFGAMRAVAQLVSYEVPMILSTVGVVLLSGSLMMGDIIAGQTIPYIFVQPMGFLVFLMAAAAEVNRTPFDLMEAESEIVAGFHVEYTGMKFGVFLLGEYAATFGWSTVITTLFLGGWRGPFLPSYLWFLGKALLVFFIFIWFRATWPRVRVDQLLGLAWKFFFPLSLANLLVTALEILVIQEMWGLGAADPLPKSALLSMGAVNLMLMLGLVLFANRFSSLSEDERHPLPAYPTALDL